MTIIIVKCKLVFIIFLIFDLIQAYKINEACDIPSGQKGFCISSEKCPTYEKEINKVPLRNIEYLRQVQCGYSEDKPNVCCPVDGNYKFVNISVPNEQRFRRSKRNFVFSTAGRLPSDDECGTQAYDDRIVGGEVAGIDEFPWMALLFYKNKIGRHSFSCGGTLINERYVMTAAHCLQGNEYNILGGLHKVRLGEYDVDTDVDCIIRKDYRDCADPAQDFTPEEIIVHPGYTPNVVDQQNDIGLIRLDRTVSYTDFIMPVCLPKPSKLTYRLQAPAYLYVAGWGRNETGISSNVKLKVKIPIYDQESCTRLYSRYNVGITSNQFCAGGELGSDSCKGDSGGPLMDMDVDIRKWVALGIVSIGPNKCGKTRIPGIYVKVVNYVPWIERTIRD